MFISWIEKKKRTMATPLLFTVLFEKNKQTRNTTNRALAVKQEKQSHLIILKKL